MDHRRYDMNNDRMFDREEDSRPYTSNREYRNDNMKRDYDRSRNEHTFERKNEERSMFNHNDSRELDNGRLQMGGNRSDINYHKMDNRRYDRDDFRKTSEYPTQSGRENMNYGMNRSNNDHNWTDRMDRNWGDRSERYGHHETMWEKTKNFFGKGPKGYKRSDERLKEEVNEALYRHAEIDASEIEVTVKDGEVCLKGTVEDRRTKRMAEDCAENITGVSDVRNEIRVQSQLQRNLSLASDTNSKTDRSNKNKSGSSLTDQAI